MCPEVPAPPRPPIWWERQHGRPISMDRRSCRPTPELADLPAWLQSRGRHTATNGDRSRKLEATAYCHEAWCLVVVCGLPGCCVVLHKSWAQRFPPHRPPEGDGGRQRRQPMSLDQSSEIGGRQTATNGGRSWKLEATACTAMARILPLPWCVGSVLSGSCCGEAMVGWSRM